MKPAVSVVVVTYSRAENLKELLGSLASSPFTDYELILVNNGTQDIKSDTVPNAQKIINNGKNLGLAKARSQGAELAQAPYILFVDDDNILESDTLQKLKEQLDANPNLIAVGPITYYQTNRERLWFVSGGISLTTSMAYFYSLDEALKHKLGDCLVETQTLHNCFMVRRELGEKVGWFDAFLFMGGTEVDLFLKIKRFFPGKLATCLDAKCYHDIPLSETNKSRAAGLSNPTRAYFFMRNRGVLFSRYAKLGPKIILAVVFYPIFAAWYVYLGVRSRNLLVIKNAVLGTLSGWTYLVTSLAHQK